jgi:hypothetical protein
MKDKSHLVYATNGCRILNGIIAKPPKDRALESFLEENYTTVDIEKAKGVYVIVLSRALKFEQTFKDPVEQAKLIVLDNPSIFRSKVNWAMHSKKKEAP